MADKFTDLLLKGLKPEAKEYTKREKGGFGVRVMPSGRKVFFFLYRVDGQRRFLNLGDYPATSLQDARKKYEAAAAQVKLLKNGLPGGADPVGVKTDKSAAREERRKAPTVADLIDEYLTKHAKPKKRGWQEDKRILEKDALPAWGKRKAADITKRDVVLLLERIVERGSPGSANNNFKIIRKMFAFAVDRDILPISPCIGVKMPAPLNTRERTLSESEIKTLWTKLDDAGLSDEIRRAIKLILVTAQRPGEVIGMHSSEIDGNWWTIPAERAKNGKSHRVYLTDTALSLIGDTTGKGFIFPCPHNGKDQAIAVNALPRAVRRNMAGNRLDIDHFTPHDLRRTAATFMAMNGEMDEVIDAVLNHSKQGVIKVYNQYRYDKEKQAALEAWEQKIKIILAGEKVVDLGTERQKRKAA